MWSLPPGVEAQIRHRVGAQAQEPPRPPSATLCVEAQPIVVRLSVRIHSHPIAVQVDPVRLDDPLVLRVQQVARSRVRTQVEHVELEPERAAAAPPRDAIRQEVFNEESDSRLKRLEVIHQLERIRKDAEISHLRNAALQQEIEERKKAETQLRDLATSDPLTGLFNRRQFFALADRELVRSRFMGYSLAVILMDLDSFKQINDTHGHLVGDKVLMAVAHNIGAIIRETDLACRYGGDEFILLLPETELLAAKKVADRLRRSIIVHTVPTERGPISVKASLGVVGVTGKIETTLEDLLSRADQALYKANENRRNRVVIAA